MEEAHVRGAALGAEHTLRFAAYVRSLGDDAAAARPPGSGWTVGEVVAHVRSIVERYTGDPRRSATPEELTAQNAEDVARLAGDGLAAAADAIEERVPVLATLPERVPPGAPVPFHAGQTITLAGAWGNLLGELLAHGDDVARATGTSFGVPGEDLEALWRYMLPVAQGWLRPEVAGLRESWLLRLPFGDVGVALDQGTLRWGGADLATPDYEVVAADAAELALAFPYRRRPVTDPALALLATRFREF